MGYQGNCLCGSVAFNLAAEPFYYVICHCQNCKQAGGGAFMANAFFKSEQVTISKGQENIKDYNDTNTKSGDAVTRSFCSNCGSSLFLHPSAAGDITVVHAANIKGSDNWVPRKEFFGEKRWEWLKEITFHRPPKKSKL